MMNERDIEFTASPALPQGADFTPGTGFGATPDGGPGSTGAAPLERARGTAQRLVSTAQERATEQLHSRFDAQRHRAADSLTSVARSLRDTTRNAQGSADGITRYMGQAADRVDEIAHYLHDRELDEIVGEVEDFARRQPVAFFGGAFALGVLGARFLKSSQGRHVAPELREHRGTQELTSRIRDPERDAVGRPDAPGYAPPSERAGDEAKPAGPRYE